MKENLKKIQSIQLKSGRKEIYFCRRATVQKVYNMGHAGFLFDCKNSSAEVIYDTNVRKDGSIKRIELNLIIKDGEILSYKNLYPAVHIKTRGSKRCDSAFKLDRITGELPFPADQSGYILPGIYKREMSDPCGTLIIKINNIN